MDKANPHSTPLTRRTILRATAASATIMAPAVALGAVINHSNPDPVLVLFAQWKTACQALYDYREAQHAIDNYDDTDTSEALWARHDSLEDALLFAQATTLQGVIAKIQIAAWSCENSPYERPGVTGDMDQRFVFSAHADAARLAGGAA
jgi:hypothetical protein